MPFSVARTVIASRISRLTARPPYVRRACRDVTSEVVSREVRLLDLGVLDDEHALVGAERDGRVVCRDELAAPGDPVALGRAQGDLGGTPHESLEVGGSRERPPDAR